MNKFIKVVFVIALAAACMSADARGGFSSGGRGGFSSGGFSGRSSFSAPSRSSFSAPRPSYTSPSRPSFSAPARPPVRTATTSVTRSTTTRSYSSRVNYGGGHMYGGLGMGYGYSNGIMTGLILGSMMHPYGTMMYAGPGMYANNALLYPDGRVVNQQGVLVGTYNNGQFATVENGGVVAQAAPADAFQQPAAQPVIIQHNDPTGLIAFLTVSVIIVFVLLLIFF